MRPARRLAAIAVVALAPAPAAACSLAPWIESSERLGAVEFIGRAAADTLEAGPGAMKARAGEGHFGFSRRRRIHGQVVHVSRLASFASPALRAAIQSAGGRVVLVPWDYGPDCGELTWGRSARWMQPGTEGLFAAGARDRAHWVAGIPTFDVRPGPWTPYTGILDPGLLGRAARSPAAAEPALTAAQLLDLRERLPAFGETERRLDAALGPLEAWARANPALARREPAAGILSRARRDVATAHFMRRPVPYAGTYRVTLRLLDRGDSAVFFARTFDRPTARIAPDEPESGDAATGMEVVGCAAPFELWLTFTICRFRGERSDHFYFDFMDASARGGDKVERRGGEIRFHGLGGRLWIGGPSFRRRLNAIWPDTRSSANWGIAANDSIVGVFTAHPDGRVTFEQVVSRGGKALLSLRAERVSLNTFNDH